MPSARVQNVLRLLAPFGAAAVVALLCGRLLWFFCDDAFINYRFSGNAHDGHGLVWNPPPWAPVEGYTSFLWVWGLWIVWEVIGLPPPVTAVPITMACGLLTLWCVGRAVAALALPERHERWRPWFAGVVLVGTAANHTFATWLSSGMETALFGLAAVAWTLRGFGVRGRPGAGDLLALVAWSSLAFLVRPDGVLLVFGTIAIALHGWWRGGPARRALGAALAAAVVPAAHFLWRRATYGEWLPNTYYCKVTAAWPESGLRYLYCFAVEHGVWLWAPLAAGWAAVAAWRGPRAALVADRWPATVAVGTWAAYVGYYTLVVGGDHFAWRIFAHFVPLLLWSALAMAVALRRRPAAVLGGLFAFAVVAGVPGWWLERQLAGREREGFVRVAGRVPAALRPLLRGYDRHQAWLLLHSVGFRRAFHAELCAIARAELPERRPGQVAGSAPGQRLVWRADAVGVVGWALPDVAILDGHGLNDWVIARTAKAGRAPGPDEAVLRGSFAAFDRDGDARLDSAEIVATSHLLTSIGPQVSPATWAELLLSLGDRDGDDALAVDELVLAVRQMLPARQMAHEREPPPGYIEALRPNVVADGGGRRVDPAVVPLSDAEVRAVEAAWRARIGR